MKHFGGLFVILLGAFLLPQVAAEGPLEILPSGMTRCEEDLPCIRLLVRNGGNSSVSFGANGRLKPSVPHPGLKYFYRSNGNWIEFGQVLGTFMAPRRIITVRPGERKRLYVVVTDVPTNADALRISIQERGGAFHDSHPFDLAGAAITASR